MHTSTMTAVLLSLVLVAACGGEATDPAPASQPTQANPNVYPNTKPITGDWFVYTYIDTPTLPAIAQATERSNTRYFRNVDTDGSMTRVDTSSAIKRADKTSTFADLSIANYNAAAQLTSSQYGALLCTNTPAYRSSPPIGTAVGASYTQTSNESCSTVSGTPSVRPKSVTGRLEAIELKSIPLGTFNTFKYSQTLTAATATAVTTTLETCWIDRDSGRTVECISTYNTTPVGNTTPTASGSTRLLLEGYRFSGQPAVGAAVRRFAGQWTITFVGQSAGFLCTNVLIDLDGGIYGFCSSPSGTSGAIEQPSFSVTGFVRADGSAAVTSTTGATMVGNFTSPESASGNWAASSASGTWTAKHL